MSSFVRLVTVGFVCFIGKTFIQAAPLFEDETPVELKIIAPLKSLKKQRGDDPQWLEGQVLVKGPDGLVKTLDIKLKARGNFRRKQDICSFPPFWLNFNQFRV
tara:strand:- start:24 stop:332 length:309 start_codon:yes stop_codon:yes gene_type:complete